MHTLITGEIGVGKSTLIKRLLAHTDRKIYGFVTEKRPFGAGERLYINPAEGGRVYGENVIGEIMPGRRGGIPEAFDRLGVPLLSGIPEGSIVLMDELGFMESRALDFCRAVLEVLDGEYQVIAAVKPRDTPFLKSVREHPNGRLYTVTAENRDGLYSQILREMDFERS